MPIVLPRIANKYCMGFSACGKLESENEEDLRLVKEIAAKHGQTYSDYKVGRSKFYVLTDWGGDGGRHVHIDIVRQTYIESLRDFNLSARTHVSLDEVEKRVESVVGKEVTETIRGFFSVPLDKLPKDSVVASTFFETKAADLSVRVKRAQLEIKGAPINWIEWKMNDKKKAIEILLVARASLSTGEDFVDTIYNVLEYSFNAFILGDKGNGLED